MKCEGIQSDLPLYCDGRLTNEQSNAIEAHFEFCPVCRAKNAAHREMLTDLRRIGRPAMSAQHQRALRISVATELSTRSGSIPLFSTAVGEWLQMRLMPFAVGLVASLAIGIGVLTFLLNNIPTADSDLVKKTAGSDTGILIASNRGPITAGSADQSIYPADFAKTRLAVSGESPSLNPQGALVAMTSSLLRESKGNDGVVVVADVFSNGLARIQEVVSPSYNSRTITDLEKALEAELGDAAFLPASLDQRSDNVRVVLRFQQVNVNTRQNVKRKR